MESRDCGSDVCSSDLNEGRPTVLIHPEDAVENNIEEGQLVVMGSARGQVRLHAKLYDVLRRGFLISEGLWPNSSFVDGKGINSLTGSDPGAPIGGGCYHDNRVWIKAT